MRKILCISLLLVSLISISQTFNDTIVKKNKIYSSAGGELIFSFVNPNTDFEESSLRFSAWYHTQFNWHYDITQNVGVFWGLGSRNIGYTTKPKSNNIYIKNFTILNQNQYELDSRFDSTQQITTIKRRVYTLGIPLGIKIGAIEKNQFLFLGGEIEFPFHFKNKVWVDDKKVHIASEWFSKQNNSYFLSVFAGFQFPWGTNIKLKWYLNDFLNSNYRVVQNGGDVKPYEKLKSQMFYISFGMNMFNSKKVIKQIQTIEDKGKQESYSL